MKQIIFFFVITLSYLYSSSQPGNDELTKLWNDTKAYFLKKGEEAKKIAIIARDSKAASHEVINRAFGNANRVTYFSRQDVKLDSLGFYGLSQFNDSLNVSMKILLNKLDSDKHFALLKTYATYKMLYEAADRHVHAAKGRFNDLAPQYKSPYHFNSADTTMPEVKF